MFYSSKRKAEAKYINSSCANLLIGIIIIFWHILLIFIPILIFYFVTFQSNFLYVFTVSVFIILNGTRMRALGNIIHECCHAHYVPGRKANKVIGYILCSLELSCFDTYCKEHFSHHRYLGNILRDDDFRIRSKLGLNEIKKLRVIHFIKLIMFPKNWIYILKSSFKINIKNNFLILLQLVYLFVLINLCYFFGFKLILLFIIIPFFTSYQIMKLFSDFLDHGGLYFNAKNELKTRNHYFSINILNWIFFPRNDSFHLIHHMYPNLPTKKFITKHKTLLKENTNYSKRRHCIF